MLLPICVALKPPEGSYAENARRWGVGGYAIDACRVETSEQDASEVLSKWSPRTQGFAGKVGYNYGAVSRPDISTGRVPGRNASAAARIFSTLPPTTLKPLELCRWLARLILPPLSDPARSIREDTTGSHGRLLVPFAGVLSEAIGAALAGWPEIVAIEREETFVEQGAARFKAWGPFEAARAEAIEKAGGLKAAVDDHGRLRFSSFLPETIALPLAVPAHSHGL